MVQLGSTAYSMPIYDRVTVQASRIGLIMTLCEQSAAPYEGVSTICWRFWGHHIIIPCYRRRLGKKEPGPLDPAYGIGSPEGRLACWAARYTTTRYVVYEKIKQDITSCMYQ
jgi:hypothetical protein